MPVNEKKITLDEGLLVGDKLVKELTMKRLTVGMMIDAHAQVMSEYGFEPTQAMVEPFAMALACSVPAPDMLAMDYGPDYVKLQRASAFLIAGGSEEVAAEEPTNGQEDLLDPSKEDSSPGQ